MHHETGLRQPQQRRSARTLEQILDAVTALLRERNFDDMSVGEIASRAGISVGGFYARFSSKEALIDWFEERLLQERLARLVAEFAPEKWEGAGLEAIILHYVSLGIELFRQNETLVRKLAVRIRADDAAARERARKLNQRIDGQVAGLLLARRSLIRSPDPELAVRLGLLAVSAALREVLLFGRYGLNLVTPDDAQLERELTRLFVGYLQHEPSGRAAASAETGEVS